MRFNNFHHLTFFFSVSFSLSSLYPLSFLKSIFHFINLMLLFLLLLLLCTSSLVVCDDTEALRSAVKCLCEGNSEGEFGSCCVSHSYGSSLTLSDTKCFITDLVLDSNEQYVEQLFVIHHFLQFSSLFHFIQSRSTRKD